MKKSNNFDDFSQEDFLTPNEMEFINGGETGWYYIGKAYGWVERHIMMVGTTPIYIP